MPSSRKAKKASSRRKRSKSTRSKSRKPRRRSKAASHARPRARKPASQKKTGGADACPTDKVVNPATGRCVSRTGAIGKKLLGGIMAAPRAPTVVPFVVPRVPIPVAPQPVLQRAAFLPPKGCRRHVTADDCDDDFECLWDPTTALCQQHQRRLIPAHAIHFPPAPVAPPIIRAPSIRAPVEPPPPVVAHHPTPPIPVLTGCRKYRAQRDCDAEIECLWDINKGVCLAHELAPAWVFDEPAGPSVVINPAQATINTRKLYEVYNASYRPPAWALTLASLQGPERAQWHKYAATARVYYDAKDDLKEVVAVAEQREPVNIGMSRSYNMDALERDFGWRVSRYISYFNATGKLAPNIAVYTRTPISLDASVRWDLPLNKLRSADVHVISVTGYAFDDRKQPDYLWFVPRFKAKASGFYEDLVERHRVVFAKIFKCALDRGLDTIVLSRFGLASFAELYPEQGQLWEAWAAGLDQALAMLSPAARAQIREVSMMGGTLSPEKITKFGIKSESYGRIPDIMKAGPLANRLATTLFVNAWDPHSIVGNGNFQDASLDGYFGRWTALGFLSWPLSNPVMRYVAV